MAPLPPGQPPRPPARDSAAAVWPVIVHPALGADTLSLLSSTRGMQADNNLSAGNLAVGVKIHTKNKTSSSTPFLEIFPKDLILKRPQSLTRGRFSIKVC